MSLRNYTYSIDIDMNLNHQSYLILICLNVDAQLSSRLRNLKCLFYYSMGIRWSLKVFRCTNSLKIPKNCFIMSFRKCQFVCCGIICHLHNKYHLDWGPNSRSAESHALFFCFFNLPNSGLITKYAYVCVVLCTDSKKSRMFRTDDIWTCNLISLENANYVSNFPELFFFLIYIFVVSSYLISWTYPDKCVNLWITKFLVDFSTN